MPYASERKIHLAFQISLILKGLHALVEIIGGILVFIVTKAYIVSVVLSITQEELSQDPKDIFAQYLIHASNNFSAASQHFIALYLLSHGIIKLFLVVALFKEKLWAYPVSLAVFSGFIIYQLYRFAFTHSLWLLLFTLFDLIIIGLTLHEYHFLKKDT